MSADQTKLSDPQDSPVYRSPLETRSAASRSRDLRPGLIIAARDKHRLDLLLDSAAAERSWEATYFLAAELDRAKVVEARQVPPQVVTMNARVRYRDESGGQIREAVLVYPGDELDAPDHLSVLTLKGALLLGLSEGQSMYRANGTGPGTGVTVLKILSQPALEH